MRQFAMTIDDGECLASDPGSLHADMDAAMLSAIRTATLMIGECPSILHGRGWVDCEVLDRTSRQMQRVRVTVEVQEIGPAAD